MDWWTEVRLATAAFLEQHGLLAAFVVLLVEEAGVPVPVPGDFLMLVLGVQARQGQVQVWQAILVMQAGTMLGATFLYGLARWGGRDLVYRYGRFIRLSPEKLDQAEHWINRHGFAAVFAGRLVPGLRIVTAVACGVFKVPLTVFVPAMSLGALAYIVVFTLLGFFIGTPVVAFLERLHLPLGLLGSLVPLGIFLIWMFRTRASLRAREPSPPGLSGLPLRDRLHHGAIAGCLATIASTLVLNVVLNLAGNLAFRAPSSIIEQTATRLAFALARDVTPLFLGLAVPVYVAVGMAWGAVYGGWGEPRLVRGHDGVQGVLFAFLPLATSLLVVMPLLGLGFFGAAASGPVAAVGETLRHLAYGWVLGLTYPILLARRSSRATPPLRGEHTPSSTVTPAGVGAE